MLGHTATNCTSGMLGGDHAALEPTTDQLWAESTRLICSPSISQVPQQHSNMAGLGPVLEQEEDVMLPKQEGNKVWTAVGAALTKGK